MKQGWEIKKLGEICENLDSKRVPITKSSRVAGCVPYYGASGIVDYVGDHIFNEDLLCVSEDGANLLARTYPIAFSISGKTWVNNHAHVLKFSNIITQKFVELYLNSIKLDEYVSGMAQPKLNQTMLNKIPIPIPPLPEQEKIVSILNKAFSAIEKAKQNAERNLKNAKELFDSYLNRIFTNKGEDWEEKALNKVSDIINGYAFASKDFNSLNSIKSIKITNVGVKKFIPDVDNYLPNEYKTKYCDYQVKTNNIVIALTRTIISDGVKVAIVPKEYNDALLNQRVAAIVVNENIIHFHFLYHFLTSYIVEKYILANVNTLMQPNLSINDLKNILCFIPPLITQQEIIEKLSKLSVETKNLEEIYHQKLIELDDLKKSILQKAFNGDL